MIKQFLMAFAVIATTFVVFTACDVNNKLKPSVDGGVKSENVDETTVKRPNPCDGCPTLGIRIARPVKGCESGVWVCGVVPQENQANPNGDLFRVVNSQVFVNSISNQVEIVFQDELPDENITEFYAEEGEEFTFFEDIVSDFGYSSVTIAPGTYEITYNVSEYGEVVIDILDSVRL